MLRKPPQLREFEGFAACKTKGELIVKRWRNYESRLNATLNLIQKAISQYGVEEFPWTIVCTGDRDDFHFIKRKSIDLIEDDEGNCFPSLFFCTTSDYFENLCPDFSFHNWPETGVNSYANLKAKLSQFDIPNANNNLIIWRGANTHPTRSRLCELDDKVRFDFEMINWDRSNPSNLTATNFISIEDQVIKHRFLIDVQGGGWSARLKYFIGGPRLVFVQHRVPKDFLFADLVPWKHYVPVREDFADLVINYNSILENPDLEESIIANARCFSAQVLSPQNAIWLWAERLNRIARDSVCSGKPFRRLPR